MRNGRTINAIIVSTPDDKMLVFTSIVGYITIGVGVVKLGKFIAKKITDKKVIEINIKDKET